MQGSPERVSFAYLGQEFRGGLAYIRKEKGLLVITAYFFFTMMLCSAEDTLRLPFFKAAGVSGVRLYTYVMALNVFGRLVGGVFHYRFRYNPSTKFNVALGVYITISLLEGSFIYFPAAAMLTMCFFSGFLAVNSYNIRIASTQSYVPNGYRARFNGTFLMICTLGSTLGNLLAGAFGGHFRLDYLISVSQALNLAAIFLIMYRGREHVRLIYNREV